MSNLSSVYITAERRRNRNVTGQLHVAVSIGYAYAVLLRRAKRRAIDGEQPSPERRAAPRAGSKFQRAGAVPKRALHTADRLSKPATAKATSIGVQSAKEWESVRRAFVLFLGSGHEIRELQSRFQEDAAEATTDKT